MKIQLPDYLNRVIHKLIRNNHLVYVVGGSLRDHLMNLPIQDYDLTTSALPEEIDNIFSKTIKAGKQFGTIIVVLNSHNIEITTLREESGYTDSRHPDKIQFCKNIYKDLKRRDFTINAMAYDPVKQELIDPYRGQSDISRKIIRCVGNPVTRLTEDTLRIFRAARFSAQLGFDIEQQTEKTIKEISQKITLPAPERIRYELIRLFESKNFKKGMNYLLAWKILEKYFGQKQLSLQKNLANIPQDFDLYQRIAYFLSPVKETLSDLLKDLKFTRKEQKLISSLIENNYDYKLAKMSVKDLALSGYDLMEIGLRGPQIGKTQRTLLQKIKKGEIKNTREDLLKVIKK